MFGCWPQTLELTIEVAILQTCRNTKIHPSVSMETLNMRTKCIGFEVERSNHVKGF